VFAISLQRTAHTHRGQLLWSMQSVVVVTALQFCGLYCLHRRQENDKCICPCVLTCVCVCVCVRVYGAICGGRD
jgi:hypothetical protein